MRKTMLLAFAFFFCNHALGKQSSEPLKPHSQAVVRTEGALCNLKLSPNKRLLAFTNEQGLSLRFMDLKTQDVAEVTPHRTGPGFFWSPDSARIFFRELIREGDAVVSDLAVFDTALNRKSVLDSIQGSTGFPVLNPFDYNVFIMHEKGILQKRLEFPGERFAKWQRTKRPDMGNWVVSQGAVVWMGELGLELKKMTDDGSGIHSFALSPDGRRIAWATQAGRVYAAVDGAGVSFIGEGRDPSWHPFRTLLVYTAARKVGSQIYDYDLRVQNLKGESRTLTQTPDLKERWPVWLDAATLIYTGENTTDLFRLSFGDDAAIASQSKSPEQL